MKEKLFSVTINDCEVQTFCSGGPGGQHQNKTASGVRIIHRASGATGECRETRSQLINKQRAFVNMVNSDKFKKWHRLECARRMGQPSISEQVRREFKPRNLKVETLDDQSRWIVSPELSPTEKEIELLLEEEAV